MTVARPARRRPPEPTAPPPKGKPKPPPAKPYAFAEPKGWARRAANLEQVVIGETVVLLGACPACGHQLSIELPLVEEVVAMRAEKDERAARTPVDVQPPSAAPSGSDPTYAKVARCNCQMKHDGRPDGVATGCGAFGLLEMWIP